MHTYRKSGKDEGSIFTVGFEQFAGDEYLPWRALRDFKTELAAAAYVCFLNGGGEGDYRAWYLNEWGK